MFLKNKILAFGFRKVLEPEVRSLPNSDVNRHQVLEELGDDIEDDEDLTEEEKDQLIDSLDTIKTRSNGKP